MWSGANRGLGIDAKTGKPIQVVQTTRLEDSLYVRVIGIWKASDEGRYLARFETLAASVNSR